MIITISTKAPRIPAIIPTVLSPLFTPGFAPAKNTNQYYRISSKTHPRANKRPPPSTKIANVIFKFIEISIPSPPLHFLKWQGYHTFSIVALAIF